MTRRQEIWIEEWHNFDLQNKGFRTPREFVKWLGTSEGVKFLNAAESRCEKEGV